MPLLLIKKSRGDGRRVQAHGVDGKIAVRSLDEINVSGQERYSFMDKSA